MGPAALMIGARVARVAHGSDLAVRSAAAEDLSEVAHDAPFEAGACGAELLTAAESTAL